MPVNRISAESLKKIMKGGVNTEDKTTVVVKFYSNTCDLCHALSDYYVNLSDLGEYEDVYFFAHNIKDEDGAIAEKLNLNGVPSIALFQTQAGRCVKTRVLEDPEKPHEKTWYTVRDIKKFINREK